MLHEPGPLAPPGVDLARQFAVVDHDGEHDHLVQVHCELRYEPEPALVNLGNLTAWYFYGGGQDLDGWFSEFASAAAWAAIRLKRPLAVEVYQESV